MALRAFEPGLPSITPGETPARSSSTSARISGALGAAGALAAVGGGLGAGGPGCAWSMLCAESAGAAVGAIAVLAGAFVGAWFAGGGCADGLGEQALTISKTAAPKARSITTGRLDARTGH